jgi:hypothetical protein
MPRGRAQAALLEHTSQMREPLLAFLAILERSVMAPGLPYKTFALRDRTIRILRQRRVRHALPARTSRLLDILVHLAWNAHLARISSTAALQSAGRVMPVLTALILDPL